jgi:hypothetical protein
MHPYIPFTVIPIAVVAAWFTASQWSGSEPGRYRVTSVAQIENPSVPVDLRSRPLGKPDIRVAVFLPHVPPRASGPEPALILHSVMTGTDVHLATINGQVVKVGDRIEGYVVKRIAADGVELAAKGKTRRLPMRPLHELPPPVQPGTEALLRNPAVQRNQNDLNREFLATLESP